MRWVKIGFTGLKILSYMRWELLSLCIFTLPLEERISTFIKRNGILAYFSYTMNRISYGKGNI